MRLWVWIVVILAIIAGYFVWNNLRVPRSTGLINGRLHPCPSTPNCVCCCHNDPAHYIAPLPYASSHTLDQIQAYLNQHYQAQVIQRSQDYMHVVITTPTMHFKDDLEFSVDEKKGIIKVRSASRVGYSDMGVNRARIDALRSYLNSQ